MGGRLVEGEFVARGWVLANPRQAIGSRSGLV